MELPGNDHIYDVTPPFLGCQATLLNLSRAALDEIRAEKPALAESEINRRALAKVEAEDTTVRLGLKCMAMPDCDKLDQQTAAAYNDFARDKAADIAQKNTLEMIKSKVVYIKNLTVGGKEITTFDELYPLASCADLVRWIQATVYSSIALSAAERKNFMPEPDSRA